MLVTDQGKGRPEWLRGLTMASQSVWHVHCALARIAMMLWIISVRFD